MKKKISLREIASKAKVSTATPSIVLNDKKNQGISEKTWKNVKIVHYVLPSVWAWREGRVKVLQKNVDHILQNDDKPNSFVNLFLGILH